ncbi:hypothetical protein Rs2_04919 [Raphanus sativus]|nr:hypothetical protein Rs2_04919 [Raphanus sativus]
MLSSLVAQKLSREVLSRIILRKVQTQYGCASRPAPRGSTGASQHLDVESFGKIFDPLPRKWCFKITITVLYEVFLSVDNLRTKTSRPTTRASTGLSRPATTASTGASRRGHGQCGASRPAATASTGVSRRRPWPARG